eukprot:TRINITY_DN7483_c0_g1_i1.p1 TRINITY_DN7483_c0_g1~~TRINITY_DN7483_c0_g1_i1.p1  ORF type:complete len:152 (+),score=28.99 TRINITY_DN7483_c0_g1_i1:337-792(+)
MSPVGEFFSVSSEYWFQATAIIVFVFLNVVLIFMGATWSCVPFFRKLFMEYGWPQGTHRPRDKTGFKASVQYSAGLKKPVHHRDHSPFSSGKARRSGRYARDSTIQADTKEGSGLAIDVSSGSLSGSVDRKGIYFVSENDYHGNQHDSAKY